MYKIVQKKTTDVIIFWHHLCIYPADVTVVLISSSTWQESK